MRGKWIAKAIVQKSISFLPDPQRANYFFQDRVTHGTTLSADTLDQSVGWAAMHLSALDRCGGRRQGATAVELGPGWYPVVPLCLFLAGFDTVHLVDLEDLGRPELAVQAIDGLLGAADRGGLVEIGSIESDRIERLRGAREVVVGQGHVEGLGELGLLVRPMDARRLELSGPPDLICSNTVLEHIRPDVLDGILVRFAELSGPETVMSHLVDHADHYAYVDDSIDVYHFLRYSDRIWGLIDNDVQPMNRLRASEYVDLYRRAGVAIHEEHRRGDDPMQLVGIPLADRFREMDPADVACLASHLVTCFGRPAP